MSDLTAIYYTANIISDYFAQNVREQLLKAIGDLPLISVSKKPLDFGRGSTNICVGDTPRSQVNIYRQALIGAKAAKTKYIAMAEDDVLYSPAHFKYRSPPGVFFYNVGAWGMFTWSEPLFTCKLNGRRNLSGLICERDLFIEAMEERFSLWPDDNKIDKSIFGEPGKYDKQLGTTSHPTEVFYANPPNIVFSHQTALSFEGLGTRKRAGQIRATEIPYWGTAEKILKLYKP
ncbi:hypothetical protein HYS84_03900 [Candidatus Saccharibacteria bacterium]|nr:hypothetical protein [Candidatus Saccharibacteria bacterium]